MNDILNTANGHSAVLRSERRTLGNMLEGAAARSNAFDTIRLIAALSVIVSHSFLITYGSNVVEPLYQLTNGQTSIGSVAVGVFFTISGVFIAASFERSSSVSDFVRKRALRVLPALLVVISLSALVIGPLITAIPLDEYFASRATWAYFANVAFLPNSQLLPGAFGSNTIPYVNGSIWTLKFEIMCYAATAVALMTGRLKRPLIVAAWLASFAIALAFTAPEQATGAMHYVISGAKLFRFFGAGVILYLFRDRVPINRTLALAALAIVLLSLSSPVFVEVAAIFGSYAVIVFGYVAPKWFRELTARGDVSYGVYVYGWPIQQLVWPISSSYDHAWIFNVLVAIPLAVLVGWLSWTFVEKPFIKRKQREV